MKNYGFIIDNRRCIGCHACTVACKSEHNVPIGVNRTWVKYIEKGTFPDSRRLFSVMRCNHCDNAPCVEICPVTALYRRDDGIVDFDNRRCIGCMACMQACPYDALYIDPETHTAAKCNYCAHRIDVGLEPACVVVCPTQAIISGDLNDPNSKISKLKNRHQVSVRKGEKGTLPALYYIDGDTASLDPLATSAISESMWGQQNLGVAQYAPDALHEGHPLDRLASFLSFGESPELRAKLTDQVRESTAGDSRRVYDAPQKGVTWGVPVVAYLWTKGISAGVAIIATLASLLKLSAITSGLHVLAALVALLFLALTGYLLAGDLQQPKRFLYVLLRPQWRSWLVKGAYIITAFGALLPIYFLLAAFGVSSGVVNFLIFGLGILTAIYTAFLFSQAKGRDYWQTPVLPFQMLAHSLLLGAAVFAILSPFTNDFAWTNFAVGSWVTYTAWVLAISAMVHLSCDLIDLFITHPSVAAQRTSHEIFRGRYARMYWLGSFLLAGVVPIFCVFSGIGGLMPLAGVSVLVGVYISQHILVFAPQQLPLS
ncbi:MAG: 4Fe-4S dicluster domain-containing protein [Pirellulaceae bacterium]